MTTDQKVAIGKSIADLMGVKADKSGRYKTTWGAKTALGLAECVFRCIEESVQPVKEEV